MRRSLLAIWPAAALCAQISLPTRVVSARLQPQDAWLTRVGRLPLAAGAHRLQVAELPSGLAPEDLRVQVAGPEGTLQGEVTLRPDQEREPDPALVAEREQLSVRAAGVDRRIQELEARERQANALFGRQREAVVRRLGRQPVSPQPVLDLLEQELREALRHQERLLALRTERTALTAQREALEARLEDQQRRDRGRPGSVDVAVQLATPGAVEVAVSYRVSGSSHWSPRYEAVLSPDRRALTLHLWADVVQATGEDWSQARIELLTHEPGAALTLPDLGAPPTLTWTPETKPAGAASPASRPAADPGQVVSVAVPGAVDLVHERPVRLHLASQTLTPRLLQVAQPRLGPVVHLVAELPWPPSFPRLPQAEVTLFQGGERVGRQILHEGVPGQPVHLALDVVPGLTARLHRVKASRRELRGSDPQQEWSLEERVDVENVTGEPQALELRDRTVRSATQSLQVETTEGTTPGFLEPEPGHRVWRLSLAPSSTASLTLGTRIRGPVVGRVTQTGDLNLESLR